MLLRMLTVHTLLVLATPCGPTPAPHSHCAADDHESLDCRSPVTSCLPTRGWYSLDYLVLFVERLSSTVGVK